MFGYEQDTTAQLAPEIQFINNNFPQTRYWSTKYHNHPYFVFIEQQRTSNQIGIQI